MKIILAIALTVSLSSCTKTFNTATAESFTVGQIAQVCDVLSPIYYDGMLDTPATKAQIRRHNAARQAFCNNQK
jgi:hypothetical protein